MASELRRTDEASPGAPQRRLLDGPVPLYHQLEQDLLERINSGEFAPGEALPTEERICAQYGVSRVTVRRALESLIGLGAILRRRGVGSFVAEGREGVRAVRLSGSLDAFLARAGMLQLEVLSLGTGRPPEDVREALQLSADESAIRLEGVSSLSSGPVIHVEIYFPLEVGGVLRKADFAPGLPIIRIIERKLGLRVAHAEQLIEPDLAGDATARRLGLAPETPILRIRRIYFTTAGQPIEAAILRYHPQRYRYTIDFRAGPAPV